MDAIFKYSETINIGDKINFNSQDYSVKEIERYPLAGGNLAFAVRLAKIL